jgi:hypothetical protein
MIPTTANRVRTWRASRTSVVFVRIVGLVLLLNLIVSGSIGALEHDRATAVDQPEAESAERQSVLVVVGAEGAPEYGSAFADWAEKWRKAAQQGDAEWYLIGGTLAESDPENELADPDDDKVSEVSVDRLEEASSSERETDREQLLRTVRALAQRESLEPLWIVLIGHGTFDGTTAKFNLRGPDISAEELGQALEGARRPQIVINCSSASSPFVNVLSGPRRIIVTATRSGFELNFTRFGGYLADAITNPAADLDKDDQVSVLEAFLYAAGQVAQFYEDENRLATEHAILDDNGDGLGTPADWFRGVRAVRGARDGAELDGSRARRVHLVRSSGERALSPPLRQRRDELEEQLEQLRAVKSERDEDDYYRELEELLVEIARIYEEP